MQHAVGSRFLETVHGTIDLATGEPVTLRRLPRCEPGDERRWVQACSALAWLWHEEMPPLLDYGFTAEGRFEAYGRFAPGIAGRPASGMALHEFLTASSADVRPVDRGPLRLGMRLQPPTALAPLLELLDDGRAGCPLVVSCLAEGGAGKTTFLRLAAMEAQRLGYVPVGVTVLERRPWIGRLLRGRSVLLLAGAGTPASRSLTWLISLSSASALPHVLLRVDGEKHPASDVVLRLGPLPPDLLSASIHIHPRGRISDDRVREAAARSGGLPRAFIAELKAPRRHVTGLTRVAEARPAYVPGPAPPSGEVDHPWRDLIADAVRLLGQGRRAAAERGLRHVAAAARRRQLALPAAAAEIELATMLSSRGRVREARDLLTEAIEACSRHETLAARAALALGTVQLADANLEAAESAFRVCRPAAPAIAAFGLAWTMCCQARYEDAERAVAATRDPELPHDRALLRVASAATALGRGDLPTAARAAGEALALPGPDRRAEAAAAALLVAVHGRIGDRVSVDRHGARALAAARAGRAPLVALWVRAFLLEARHTCGAPPAAREVDRFLRVAERMPLLLRARLWAAASVAHPAAERRRELAERLGSFVRATGARGIWSSRDPDLERDRLARDVGALVALHESSSSTLEAVRQIAEWVRRRLRARAVVVADLNGTVIARSGAADCVAAARRVVTTRLAQPPWATAESLEAAAPVRDKSAVIGAIACRWALSRHPEDDTVPLLATAASVLGPLVAALAEQVSAPTEAGDGMIGRSAAIARVRELVTRAAATPFSVLIEGESGSGKELVARAIHRESRRRLRPCVAVNCAALADDLFEAEVFGHTRGAFTGAHAERSGLFEQADGGTLFLDEVSELSPRAQAKLLRALQEGEVRRIGENHPRRVDVRVIAASNRDLDADVAAGRFRRDLLFRLAVVRIGVPSLRDRPEDIPLLAAHCWDAAVRRAGARSTLTQGATAALAQHDWPGNVRELQNVMAALAVQVPRGRVQASHVETVIGGSHADRRVVVAAADCSLEEARRAFERQFVSAALARRGGRHAAVARDLGISRQGLAKLLRRLGMGRDVGRDVI